MLLLKKVSIQMIILDVCTIRWKIMLMTRNSSTMENKLTFYSCWYLLFVEVDQILWLVCVWLALFSTAALSLVGVPCRFSCNSFSFSNFRSKRRLILSSSFSSNHSCNIFKTFVIPIHTHTIFQNIVPYLYEL